MRWILKEPTKHFLGDKESREAFLWLPRKIKNEIRWLETARWMVELQRHRTYYFSWKFTWRPVKWLL